MFPTRDSCVVKPFIRNGIPLLLVYYIGVSEINPAEVSLKLQAIPWTWRSWTVLRITVSLWNIMRLCIKRKA